MVQILSCPRGGEVGAAPLHPFFQDSLRCVSAKHLSREHVSHLGDLGSGITGWVWCGVARLAQALRVLCRRGRRSVWAFRRACPRRWIAGYVARRVGCFSSEFRAPGRDVQLCGGWRPPLGRGALSHVATGHALFESRDFSVASAVGAGIMMRAGISVACSAGVGILWSSTSLRRHFGSSGLAPVGSGGLVGTGQLPSLRVVHGRPCRGGRRRPLTLARVREASVGSLVQAAHLEDKLADEVIQALPHQCEMPSCWRRSSG